MTPGTILVVDDNEIKRYTTRRTLEAAGFSVEEVETGEEALHRVETTSPNSSDRPRLLVLDIKLPDIDGLEVCRRIKANPQTATTLVLHLSAHLTSGHDQAAGLEAGADAYLALPVDSEVLTATVRALLRLAQAEDAARMLAARWRETFDAISDAICLLGGDGCVLRINRAAARLFGCAPAEMPGKAFDALFEHVFGSEAIWKSAADQDVEVQARDGRYFRMTTDAILSEQSVLRAAESTTQTEEIVCVFSDITVRKTLENQLSVAYNREKRIADVFQQVLLTPALEKQNAALEIETQYVPAWDEALIGGDMYEVVPLSGDKTALLVADASGKGLTAAIRTAEVKYALRAFLWEGASPGEALGRLNNFVCTSQKDSDYTSFVTAALAIVDHRAGTVEICSAGAELPLLLRASGEAVVLETRGLPMGVLTDAEYPSAQTALYAGDVLLLVTDGITEARQGSDLWGYDNMVHAAQAILPSAPTLRAAGETLVAQARAYAGGAFQDDVCLLLARWNSSATTADDQNKSEDE